MRKLTTEQKAKAYDEAIRKAAILYKASEPMSACNVIIETIFPELKESEESEGEKIREKLIDTFNFYDSAMNSPYLLGIHRNDIVAWLEKQGEQSLANKVEPKEAMYDKPAWSEEDERRYRGLHNLIYSTQYCDSRKELSDWLKSIKQRIGG